jgi:DNA replication protein DnaC
MTSPTISDPLEPMADDTHYEPANCPQHGEFQQRVLASVPGLPVVRSSCPVCRIQSITVTKAREEREAAAQRLNRIADLTSTAGIPLRFQDREFGNYRADTPGQKHALALCVRFAANWPELRAKGTSLILIGGPGTGKTHLACAIGNAVINGHLATVRFITVSAMLRQFKETYRHASHAAESDVMLGFEICDLLILDEIGVQVGSEHEKLLLFEVLNNRYQNLMPTILLSNMSADDLEPFMGHRVMDRFRESGAVVPFNWESHRGQRNVRPITEANDRAAVTG